MTLTRVNRASTVQRVLVDGQEIECRLVPSLTAKKLRIKVGPDGVEVVVPGGRHSHEAVAFVSDNQSWVAEQLARSHRLRALRRPEEWARRKMLYRGEPLSVKVIQSDRWLGPNRVTLENGVIVITHGPTGRSRIGRSLENWLRSRAREHIERHVTDIAKRVRRMPNRIYVMGQRTKWGNCSKLGNLSFNWRLIMAPDYVLRYIVAHEVVHLAVPDHSRKFWLTVRSLDVHADRAQGWLSANQHRVTEELARIFV